MQLMFSFLVLGRAARETMQLTNAVRERGKPFLLAHFIFIDHWHSYNN